MFYNSGGVISDQFHHLILIRNLENSEKNRRKQEVLGNFFFSHLFPKVNVRIVTIKWTFLWREDQKCKINHFFLETGVPKRGGGKVVGPTLGKYLQIIRFFYTRENDFKTLKCCIQPLSTNDGDWLECPECHRLSFNELSVGCAGMSLVYQSLFSQSQCHSEYCLSFTACIFSCKIQQLLQSLKYHSVVHQVWYMLYVINGYSLIAYTFKG